MITHRNALIHLAVEELQKSGQTVKRLNMHGTGGWMMPEYIEREAAIEAVRHARAKGF